MREAAFAKQNKDKWLKFESVLRNNVQIHPDELSALYVEITDHLSYAQTFYPKSNTLRYLNGLSVLAHQKIYKTKRESRKRFITFYTHEFPLFFSQYHRHLLIAFLIFGLFTLIGAFSAATETFFQPTAAYNWILENANDGERVLNLQNPWNEARTSYFHESIGGYHGAKMHRYQDLVENYLAKEANEAITKLQAGTRDFSDLQTLNMLNAKYFVAGPQKEAVLTNPSAFGNAWFVSNVVRANNPDEVMDAIGNNDLMESAILNISEFPDINAGGSGTISLKSKTQNEVTYQASASGGQSLAVFSEIYYPKGWTAFIDGNEAKILRANYVLRALEIPEGEHEIVFAFAPRSYASTNSVMMICSVLLLLGFAGGLVIDRRSVKSETPTIEK